MRYVVTDMPTRQEIEIEIAIASVIRLISDLAVDATTYSQIFAEQDSIDVLNKFRGLGSEVWSQSSGTE